MKLRHNRLRALMPFLLSAIFCELFAAVTCGFIPTFAVDETINNDEQNFVNFYDGEKTVTYKTDAHTVKEALERANITLNKGDIVEPALREKITTDNFNINVYRARKVVIKDGSRQNHVTTASRNPREIAKQVGINLRNEDVIEMAPNNNFLESGTLTAYKVIRAKKINFVYYFEKITIYTQADTVGDFLEERGVKLKKDDWISSKTSTKITDNMNLSLYRQGKQTIVLHESIKFDEKTTIDTARDKNYKEITKKGEEGQKDVTYEIEMKDGQEISRNKISEIITKEPITQEITVGGKSASASTSAPVNLPAGSHEDWMAAAGISPSDYGYVNFIIGRESGWRTTASNGRYYGLYQTNLRSLSSQCPNWQSDPVCQLRAASNYKNRYGSWADAYNAWRRQGWW